MPIDLHFDFANEHGGSPGANSRKSVARRAANAAVIKAQLVATSGSALRTPCIQNRLAGFVTVRGPYPAYDVVVSLSGGVVLKCRSGGGVPGPTVPAKGGLSWTYDDHADRRVDQGQIVANPPPAALATASVSTFFPMRILDGVRTRLGTLVIAGGLRIRPQANTPFKIDMSVTASLAFSLQFTQGYVTAGGETVPFIKPTQKLIRGELTEQDLEPFWNNLLAAVDNFDDPTLLARLDELDEVDDKLADWTHELADAEDDPTVG